MQSQFNSIFVGLSIVGVENKVLLLLICDPSLRSVYLVFVHIQYFVSYLIIYLFLLNLSNLVIVPLFGVMSSIYFQPLPFFISI